MPNELTTLINAGLAGVFAVFAIYIFREFQKFQATQDERWRSFVAEENNKWHDFLKASQDENLRALHELQKEITENSNRLLATHSLLVSHDSWEREVLTSTKARKKK